MSEVFIQLTDPLKEVTVSVRETAGGHSVFMNDHLTFSNKTEAEANDLASSLSYFFECYRAPESENEEPDTIRKG